MDRFGFMMELIQEEIWSTMAQLTPILHIYHIIEENKQYLQSIFHV